MTVLDRIFGAAPPSSPNYGAGNVGIRGLGGSNYSTRADGPPAPIATVAAIISIISQTCGQLPRHVVRDMDVDRTPVSDARFSHLTGRPNRFDALSGNTFWESVFASVDGWGNSYIWQDRIGPGWANVLGIHFLMPQRIGPYREDNYVKYKVDDDSDSPRGPDEVLHIAKNAYDGLIGMSPVRAGALSHRLAVEAERTGLAFFRSGSTVGGVVMHPEKLNEPEIEEFYDNYAKFHAGGGRAGNVLLLEGNAKYERIGIPPEEAQFLETRQFSREEILGWYAPGMPHHLLGWKSTASNWGTGVEQQSIAFVKYVLLSRLRRVEEIISERLLPPEMGFVFSVEELMRGDSRARAAVHATMRQWGVLSADQWRHREGMGPRGVPDDYLSPLNMDRVSALTGRPAERAPQDAVGADWPLGDMRCDNDACASRREGRRGALLARKVSAAEVRCNQCGETTVIAPGETIRDDTDLSDALDAELTKRVS